MGAAVYTPIKDNRQGKQLLGLALGGYYSYRRNTYTLFDTQTVAATVEQFLEERPYLVSFNGIEFDYVVMSGAVWWHVSGTRYGEAHPSQEATNRALALIDPFRVFCATSYDLLQAIWQSDPGSRYTKGINSLAALCQANHLGDKLSNSVDIPAAWQRGDVALVANHCLADVRLTKQLFELAMRQGFLERDHGLRIKIPCPTRLPDWWHSDIRQDD